MSTTINGTSGVTFPDGTTQNTVSLPGMRNRIINGSMQVDQRNTGASVTPSADAYVIDRWFCGLSQASKFSVQRSTTAPAGFVNSQLFTSTSAYTVGASESFRVEQKIEAFNVSDLGWGTAAAQTVTVSFWVRSSLTGTFGGSVFNYNATRSCPFSYTINAANTWEQKSVTIAGDTSGSWYTNNNLEGIRVGFSLGAGASASGTVGAWASATYLSATGATSVVGTNGATFYITGVQLEKGSTATSFDYRPYGTELALCQRYYTKYLASQSPDIAGIGVINGTTAARFVFQTAMRSTPSVGYSATAQVSDQTATPAITSVTTIGWNFNNVNFTLNCSGGGLTAARAAAIRLPTSGTDYIDISAEL